MMNLALLLILVVLFTMLSYAFITQFQKRSRLKNRTNQYVAKQETRGEEKPVEERRKFSLLEMAGKALQGLPVQTKTENLLQQGGFSLTPSEFLALRISTAFLSAGMLWLFFPVWYLAVLALPFGFYVPVVYARYKRKKRLELLTYQLVETLGTMANSLRAGFSFLQSMQMVAKEMPDPLGPEFGRAVNEIRLGRPVEEAMHRMTERMPNKELEVIVQSIIAQRESGGNLAELLLAMEETIRGRIRVLDELKTLVAQGKISSWIITMLPVALAVFIYMFNREYGAIMFQHPLGWTLSFLTLISIFIGWLLIQKVIKIEV
ncbi:type II secretion system F family protein [Alkalicoccus halolimnae]|uniref:Type II secretion system F family protein n=1 Tax=Alkalicoccus halolimnae TaxID=1667239 RepID=A0A5C7F9M6_9BACI|nr:type II secretion system F family protein [Alkalicoccus halolimnae]TXF86088.1 hypothetical protein FTX54_05580 [Alkalicoccus halolimnae]